MLGDRRVGDNCFKRESGTFKVTTLAAAPADGLAVAPTLDRAVIFSLRAATEEALLLIFMAHFLTLGLAGLAPLVALMLVMLALAPALTMLALALALAMLALALALATAELAPLLALLLPRVACFITLDKGFGRGLGEFFAEPAIPTASGLAKVVANRIERACNFTFFVTKLVILFLASRLTVAPVHDLGLA